MPRKAYSEQERERIREALLAAALQHIAAHGLKHASVETICAAVGISKTFFYSFFPSKEALVLQALSYQQPKLLAFARTLMSDPKLSWREGLETFLRRCCYSSSGIAVSGHDYGAQGYAGRPALSLSGNGG